MKRLLSLILALALVIGMVPATFAESENPIYSPTYTFNRSVFQDSAGNYPSTVETLGNYSFVGTTGVWNWAGSAETTLLNVYTAAIGSSDIQFRVDQKPVTEDNALVLTLQVDKSGTYEPKFAWTKSVAMGDVDVYLVHEDVLADKGWSLTTSTIGLIKAAANDEPSAEVKHAAYVKLTGSGTAVTTEHLLNLNAGKYYMFAVVSGTSDDTYSNARTYGSLRYLTLTCKGTVTANVGATALRVGGSTTISAVVTDGTGAASDAAVTYTSSDDKILTVDGEGNISAVGEGTATITATATVGGVDVFDSVKITSTLVKGTITATAGKTALKKGETTTITATAKDADGNPSNAVISFESSDKSVATVDANGTVTAVGEGTATITAKATIDGIPVTSNGVDVTVSVVWDPVYSFYNGAFTSSVTRIIQVTDSSMLNESVSSGKWQYFGGLKSDANGGMNIGSDSISNKGVMFYTGASTADGYWNALVLTATLENAGVYKPTINFWREDYGGKLNIYFVPKAYADGKNWFMGQVQGPMNAIDDSKLAGSPIAHIATIDTHKSAGTTTSFTSDNGFYLPAGEHYIVMSISQSDYENTVHDDKRQYGLIKDITLTRQASVEVTAAPTTITVGSDATLTSVVKDNRDNVVESAVTYESLNTDIATVSGNVVTAVAEGTATIKATAANGATGTVEIKVEAKKISLAYTTSVDEENIVVEAHKAGSVTVNAPEKDGYTFSHWVRGTAASGVWVSADAGYTFDLVSPTYLTAIYVEEDAKIVEFFNGNSELLAQETVKEDGTVEKPADPSMVGFRFLRWITAKDVEFVNADIIAPLTRVVAEFEDDTATYNVAGQTDVKYDTAITKTSNSEVAWKRGNVVVGYGTSYTYNVWADVESITSEAISEKKPLVYIDPTVKDVGAEKACMIEFDGAGKEIVEVGILFSAAGTTPEVGSCMYKATSKTNGGDDGHGQLTAKPANNTQTVARGYIIYLDNGEYKTEYSEVLSLNN